MTQLLNLDSLSVKTRKQDKAINQLLVCPKTLSILLNDGFLREEIPNFFYYGL